MADTALLDIGGDDVHRSKPLQLVMQRFDPGSIDAIVIGQEDSHGTPSRGLSTPARLASEGQFTKAAPEEKTANHARRNLRRRGHWSGLKGLRLPGTSESSRAALSATSSQQFELRIIAWS